MLNSKRTTNLQAQDSAIRREATITSLLATTARAWNLVEKQADGTTHTVARHDWPRAVDADGKRIVMYWPQVTRWISNRIEARAVLVVSAASGARTYGVAWFAGLADIEGAAGLLRLTQIEFWRVEFPSEPEMAERIERALATFAPTGRIAVSLDELQTTFAAAQGFARAMHKGKRNWSFTDWVRHVRSGY